MRKMKRTTGPLTDALESTEIQLMNNDLSKIKSEVNELIAAQNVGRLRSFFATLSG